MCDILMGSGINYDTTYLISHRSAFYDNSDVLGFTFNKYESPIHKKNFFKTQEYIWEHIGKLENSCAILREHPAFGIALEFKDVLLIVLCILQF